MRNRQLGLLGLMVVVVAACRGGADEGADTVPAIPPTSVSPTTTQPVGNTSTPAEEVFGVDAAIADLQARLPGVEVTLVSAENVAWMDTSLGCPQPGRVYAQVLTEGVRIVLAAGGRNYFYHGDRASGFLCETPEDPFAPS